MLSSMWSDISNVTDNIQLVILEVLSTPQLFLWYLYSSYGTYDYYLWK